MLLGWCEYNLFFLWDWFKGVIGKVKELVMLKGIGVVLVMVFELSVWKFVNIVRKIVIGYREVLGF